MPNHSPQNRPFDKAPLGSFGGEELSLHKLHEDKLKKAIKAQGEGSPNPLQNTLLALNRVARCNVEVFLAGQDTQNLIFIRDAACTLSVQEEVRATPSAQLVQELAALCELYIHGINWRDTKNQLPKDLCSLTERLRGNMQTVCCDAERLVNTCKTGPEPAIIRNFLETNATTLLRAGMYAVDNRWKNNVVFGVAPLGHRPSEQIVVSTDSASVDAAGLKNAIAQARGGEYQALGEQVEVLLHMQQIDVAGILMSLSEVELFTMIQVVLDGIDGGKNKPRMHLLEMCAAQFASNQFATVDAEAFPLAGSITKLVMDIRGAVGELAPLITARPNFSPPTYALEYILSILLEMRRRALYGKREEKRG